MIADYQFGKGIGEALFPSEVEFMTSRTGRVRQILYEGNRLATVRAEDGRLTLSIYGAVRIHRAREAPHYRVVMNEEAAPFIADGKNAFARHVVRVDPQIRAGDEVLLVDEDNRLIGAGKAMLSAEEMLSFTRGLAVDTRVGVD